MFGDGFVGDEVFDELDDLKALPGSELKKSAQQAETFDGTVRGCAELKMQFSREIEVFHLAPMTGLGPSGSGIGNPIENRTPSPNTMATANSRSEHPSRLAC
jgi:hypothetical protein